MLVTGKNFRANNGLRVTTGPVEPSDDTPAVSHSLDSSLREGAGIGLVPFIGVLAKISGYGRFSSPLRRALFNVPPEKVQSAIPPSPGVGRGVGGYRMSKTLRAVIWVGVPRRIFIRRVPASMSK